MHQKYQLEGFYPNLKVILQNFTHVPIILTSCLLQKAITTWEIMNSNKLALEEWQQVFIHLLSSLINPISNPSDQTKDSTTMHSLFKTVPGGEP